MIVLSYEPVKVGQVKTGRYVIDPNSNEVCQVVSVDHSKPGKHGSAKARLVLMGLFDGKKREYVSSVDKRINVPLIDKKTASITNIEGENIQLMDNESYDYFEALFPPDKTLKAKITDGFSQGKNLEVEYWIVMEKIKINNVREAA